MILRKNISLNEEYLKKLEPLMQKHNGNLSAVIREVIDLADAAFQDPDSVKRLISGLKKEQNLTSSALTWSLKNLAGRLPDEETLHNIVGNNISSVSSLEKLLNGLVGEIYWESSVKVSFDDDIQPRNATFSIAGKNPDMSRFLAAVIALSAAKRFNLGISEIRSINGVNEMNMKRGESEWVFKSIIDNFGYMDAAFSELYKKPDFWNIIINLYAKMDYDMAAMSRQFFNEILAGKTAPKDTVCIERFFSCPINQIPQDEFIKKLKSLYEPMGIIEKMDIYKDSLVIHHGLTEPEAIKKLANIFVELLKLNGRTYSFVVGENLIVLKCQQKVNEIVIRMLDDLKTREVPFSSFHSYLLKILDVLKSVPYDEELIKSVGSKLGISMIQNYEKEKKIDRWDVGSFVNYLQEMGGVLMMDSNWEIVSENVIHGRISTCPMVNSGGDNNVTGCTLIKGIFKGYLSHAFGDESEKIYKTQTSCKNGSCEIYVAF